MAMPKLSNGQMKNILIRIAEVKAATQVVPKALFALCNIMLPIAVMENCKPIGTPIARSVLAKPEWNFLSLADSGRRIGNLRII